MPARAVPIIKVVQMIIVEIDILDREVRARRSVAMVVAGKDIIVVDLYVVVVFIILVEAPSGIVQNVVVNQNVRSCEIRCTALECSRRVMEQGPQKTVHTWAQSSNS